VNADIRHACEVEQGAGLGPVNSETRADLEGKARKSLRLK
jgi:hypothetical protein